MKRKMMTHKTTTPLFFIGVFIAMLFFSVPLQAQEENIKEAKKFMAEAEQAMSENNFPLAEAKYREAIAKDNKNAEARYNLGNLYYNKEKPSTATQRLHETSVLSENKDLKHNAYHNQGNAFMKEKKYAAAVAAYKNALRNNPTDDKTRYNLALAKEKLKKEEQQNKDNKDKDKKKDDKNKDKKENQDQDKKEGGEDQQDKKKDKSDQNQNEDEKKGDQKKEEGDQQKKEQQQPKQEKGDENNAEKNQQQQPAKGQLSPQQINNLLEAMENQEKKIQDKINAKKEKGQKRQTEKDW